MWFKGVLTSKKLGTLIDSELLIYCLQADYILSHIWVCILKMQLPPHWLHCCILWLQLPACWLCCCVLWSQLHSPWTHCVVCVCISAAVCQSAVFSAVWCQSDVIGDQWPLLQALPLISSWTLHSLSVCACLNDLLFHCLSTLSHSGVHLALV
jgi:hypothetical protein